MDRIAFATRIPERLHVPPFRMQLQSPLTTRLIPDFTGYVIEIQAIHAISLPAATMADGSQLERCLKKQHDKQLLVLLLFQAVLILLILMLATMKWGVIVMTSQSI